MPINHCNYKYQSYDLRAKVTSGIALASSAKLSVVENAAHSLPFASGWTAPNATLNISSKAVPSDADRQTNTDSGITINPNNGIITITYTDKIAKDSPTLLLIPKANGKLLTTGRAVGNAVIEWECHADTAPEQDVFPHILGTLSSKYVPFICRSQQSKQLELSMKQVMENIISILKCEFALAFKAI